MRLFLFFGFLLYCSLAGAQTKPVKYFSDTLKIPLSLFNESMGLVCYRGGFGISLDGKLLDPIKDSAKCKVINYVFDREWRKLPR